MISQDEAQELMIKFLELRKRFEETHSPQDEKALKAHEAICIDQFQYLITMRTNKYRQFANHDDLYQDGLEALLKAMKTYNPKKGSWFWWAHKYIDTKISRMANLHTAIRYPLKFAKNTIPHKENNLPTLADNERRPDIELETLQIQAVIQSSMLVLNNKEHKIITMFYGLDGDKPMSVNKICLKLGITRTSCKNTLKQATRKLMKKIRL